MEDKALRILLSGSECKPPNAALVKSLGSERLGKVMIYMAGENWKGECK